MIVIVNYGLGNLGSIKNMLRKIGHDSVITNDAEVIQNAQKLILPGVGAFDTGMKKLEEFDLIELLNQKALVEKIPVLGICLGSQLMCKGSEEGNLPGLGWFDADVVSFKGKFDEEKELPVPNMGWVDVETAKECYLTKNLPIEPRFYFVHSYFMKSNTDTNILFNSTYGFRFVSGLQKDNLYGVQFHPEKSHKFGYQLLRNFAEIK